MSYHAYKIQVKVDIGESHGREIGGSKSGLTLVNYISKSTFSYLGFLGVLQKKIDRNESKITTREIIEKWAQGGPKIATKWLRINEKKYEKLKNHLKNKFLVIPFFQWFFESRKNKKKTPKSWTWPSGGTESAFWIWYHNASSSYELLFAAIYCFAASCC